MRGGGDLRQVGDDGLSGRVAGAQLVAATSGKRRGGIRRWMNVMLSGWGNSQLHRVAGPRQSQRVGCRRVHDQRRYVGRGFITADGGNG